MSNLPLTNRFHPFRERLSRCGIRHDHVYTIFDIHQVTFSQYMTLKVKMPKELYEDIDEYLTDIEKINKRYTV